MPTCTNCGAKLRNDASFCVSCGASQETRQDDVSSSIASSTCPRCGAEIGEAEARTCPSCGVELVGGRGVQTKRPWYSRKLTLILLIPPVVVIAFAVVALLAWCVSSVLSTKGEAEGVVRAFLKAATAGNAEVAVELLSSSATYQDELAESIRTGKWQGYEDISVSGFEVNTSSEGSSNTPLGL